jgi:hypothetical protein
VPYHFKLKEHRILAPPFLILYIYSVKHVFTRVMLHTLSHSHISYMIFKIIIRSKWNLVWFRPIFKSCLLPFFLEYSRTSLILITLNHYLMWFFCALVVIDHHQSWMSTFSSSKSIILGYKIPFFRLYSGLGSILCTFSISLTNFHAYSFS